MNQTLKPKSSFDFPFFLKITSIHFLLLFLFTSFFYYLFTNRLPIFPSSLLEQWDVNWYKNIIDNGYVYDANNQNNTAFFPLFPYVWKCLQLNALSIALVNLGLFIIGFYLILTTFQISKQNTLLYLGIPGLFFFTVPYTESLFFFFCTILLIGLKKNNLLLTIIGIFFSVLTRSSSIMFIPVFVGLAILYFDKKQPLSNAWFIISCLLTVLASLSLVVYFQFTVTGVWFASFKSQVHWWHYLQIPKLPLTSWGGQPIIRIDSIAALTGALSALYLIYLFFKKINSQNPTNENMPFYFSFLYMAGLTASMLMYQGGGLASLNRYIFCTPCFLIALHYLPKYPFRLKHALYAFLLLILYGLFFGIYKHIQLLLWYSLLSLFLISLFYSKSEEKNNYLIYLHYSVLLLLQSFLFARFIAGEWVG